MEQAARAEPVVTSEDAHGVVVHYHEIGLKGRNRGFFERKLVDNLRGVLRPFVDTRVEVMNGRLLVRTSVAPSDALLDAVARTFGVAFLAPVRVVSSDVGEMTAAALSLLEGKSFRTFAIAARRATKEFALTSRDINVELGAAVQ